MESTLLIAEDAAVRTITLNRPDRRNAMTPAMQSELIDAMQDAARSHCHVLVFQGAGSAFCAGLDLSALQSMAGKSADEYRADAERIGKLFRTLYELPMPTIAVVRGPAIGGGTGLATICDFTLATPSAKFGYTEVRIGFVPALVSAFLALQIGDKRSRDLLLTGRLFDAVEAHGLGLVNEALDPDALDARVQSLAAEPRRQQSSIARRNQAPACRAEQTVARCCNRPGLAGKRPRSRNRGLQRRDLRLSRKTKAGLVEEALSRIMCED